MKMADIPRPALERMPLYYRSLSVWKSKGFKTVSSLDIGRDTGVKVVQVRKDLAYFGEFGRPGIGYNVEYLMSELGRLLGFNHKTEAVMIGAGRLGTAIVCYSGFYRYNMKIAALFDTDREKIGHIVGDTLILALEQLPAFLSTRNIQLGIITVPAEAAQSVANLLVENGVKVIWNFAPVTLHLAEDVKVRNEDLAVGLATLCYFINKEKSSSGEE